MHELFSDWYQTVNPVALRETVEKRWAATEESLDAIDKAKIADLATFVALVQSDEMGWFRAIYKKHDDVMKTRGVEEELRLLAAVVLRITWERDDDLAPLSALCLLTAAFGRSNQPRWLEEHLREAARALASIARSARDLDRSVEVTSFGDVEGLNGALADTLEMIDALRESNDFLWWAFTRNSATLGQPYAGLSGSTLALAAPVDMIRLSRTLPLSAEAETLLLHIVSTGSEPDAKYSLKSCIATLARTEAQQLSQSIPTQCQLLCPMLWALRASAQGKAWRTEFERLFKIRTSSVVPVLALALEMVRELSIAAKYAE